MANQNPQQNAAAWLLHVKEETSQKKYGQFLSKDKFTQLVILEWEIADITASGLVEFKKNICDIACQTLAPIEMEFLRRNPESVNQELFLKGCAPFFENGLDDVNWEMVKEKIQSTINLDFWSSLVSRHTSEDTPRNPLAGIGEAANASFLS